MVDFFREGGWGMWVILFLGLALLGAAGRFAARPSRRQVAPIGAMALATVISSVHATLTDIGAVFAVLSDDKRFPDAMVTRVLFEGLKECTRPGAFAGAVLTVAAVLFAVGLLRMEPRAG